MPDVRQAYIRPPPEPKIPGLTNPCSEEHLLSLRCVEENYLNQRECDLYFQNYRNCKKFWNAVMLQRRAEGIAPIVPPPNERDKIIAEYRAKQLTTSTA
ncbi:unnamed protein product [Soboliphyme baturini]|uniref:Coiled-coil-helix-coiled-coil-helix domain-containing protein 7 n=1 Tax=Soboliphyme baturini TaxID=241478 RepID=A0A183IIT5_9BILA|nr:unnamed protein product [Soboliphyme baturini]